MYLTKRFMVIDNITKANMIRPALSALVSSV